MKWALTIECERDGYYTIRCGDLYADQLTMDECIGYAAMAIARSHEVWPPPIVRTSAAHEAQRQSWAKLIHVPDQNKC